VLGVHAASASKSESWETTAVQGSCVEYFVLRFLGLLKLKKVTFEIYVPDRKTTTCISSKLFLLCCVNSAALPLGHCYSLCLPRMVASWVDYSRQRTESCPVSTTPVISACWRLMNCDVKNSGALDSNPLHHSTPHRILLKPVTALSLQLS
jgi:hypothetical protein